MPWYIVKYDQGVIERAHVRIQAANEQYAEEAVLDGCGEVLITEIVGSIEMDIENVEVEESPEGERRVRELRGTPNPRSIFIILLAVAIVARGLLAWFL